MNSKKGVLVLTLLMVSCMSMMAMRRVGGTVGAGLAGAAASKFLPGTGTRSVSTDSSAKAQEIIDGTLKVFNLVVAPSRARDIIEKSSQLPDRPWAPWAETYAATRVAKVEIATVMLREEVDAFMARSDVSYLIANNNSIELSSKMAQFAKALEEQGASARAIKWALQEKIQNLVKDNKINSDVASEMSDRIANLDQEIQDLKGNAAKTEQELHDAKEAFNIKIKNMKTEHKKIENAVNNVQDAINVAAQKAANQNIEFYTFKNVMTGKIADLLAAGEITQAQFDTLQSKLNAMQSDYNRMSMRVKNLEEKPWSNLWKKTPWSAKAVGAGVGAGAVGYGYLNEQDKAKLEERQNALAEADIHIAAAGRF